MKYAIRESARHGRGVFATAPIAAGEAILAFRGPLRHRSQLDPHDYHLQIGDEHYLGPSGLADDYVNHSCDANAGFGAGLVLVARRDIAAGEEITWDYSTAINEEDFGGFPCRCGTPACRRVVRSFCHLPAPLQHALEPWLLPYLKRYLAAQSRCASAANGD